MTGIHMHPACFSKEYRWLQNPRNCRKLHRAAEERRKHEPKPRPQPEPEPEHQPIPL